MALKKIDKLILGSFIGPFILTFLVVVFILLMQHMLKYFDDIIGKGLDGDVIAQLLFYFAVLMTPVAMPLAVLLSSLITFGNLGEHFELTAIKSSGISLIRTMVPILALVVCLTALAFYINNNLVPKAALEAYSLLYDIRQKKPTLDLREGAFYGGITDVNIKVDKKYPDGVSLKNVIIYDHRKNDGNKDVTVADSGRMYTILNERYLKLELYNGYNYAEGQSAGNQVMSTASSTSKQTLSRGKFSKTQVIFDLSSFQLSRTDKKWFQGNRIMRNLSELQLDMDSLHKQILDNRLSYYVNRPSYFSFYTRFDPVILPLEVKAYRRYRDSLALASVRNDSTQKANGDSSMQAPPSSGVGLVSAQIQAQQQLLSENETMIRKRPLRPKVSAILEAKMDSIFKVPPSFDNIQSAANMVRQVHSQVQNSNMGRDTNETELRVFQIQWHKIIANSLACIAMFLIGAPLGSIIKKGGLGVPFLVSIFFFIVYYLLNMQGEKLAKTGSISVVFGVWMADLALLVIGIAFLFQARADARLFETDFYLVFMDKVKKWLFLKKDAWNKRQLA